MEALVAQKMNAGVKIDPCGVVIVPTLAFPDSNRTLKLKFLYINTLQVAGKVRIIVGY
ncbi:hypothetical protein [Anaplasma phagocytophilum]|uniref:hypothetical protein n=1 Tax=Anaplasma phagocytophilum TaxID=948 RepID=UPI00040E29A3|nr:hypothetical protein [Anaplasma phagocytophilum]